MKTKVLEGVRYTPAAKPRGMSHLAALMHEMADRWGTQQRLDAVLREQYGLVSRRQAMALGFTRRMIDCRLRPGAWVPAAPGVYRAAAVAPTFRQHCLTGALWAAPEGVVSLDVAGALWNYDGVKRPARIDVTFPTHGRPTPRPRRSATEPWTN